MVKQLSNNQKQETKPQYAAVWTDRCLDDTPKTIKEETSWSQHVSIGPRTVQFVVLTLEGAVQHVTIHGLSEDKK